MVGLKLNHASERGHSGQWADDGKKRISRELPVMLSPQSGPPRSSLHSQVLSLLQMEFSP